MAVLTIRTIPDPVLKQKAKRVSTVDSSLSRLIANMLDTMHAASGAGLAAPQVGVSLRIITIGVAEQQDTVLINPEIVRRAGEREVTEGCLSVPGYFGELKRSQTVTVKGRTPAGKEVRIKAEGLLAQALEHEIDHLNGILYLDRLESQEKIYQVEPEEPSTPAAPPQHEVKTRAGTSPE